MDTDDKIFLRNFCIFIFNLILGLIILIHFCGKCNCYNCGKEVSGLKIVTLKAKSITLKMCEKCATEALHYISNKEK